MRMASQWSQMVCLWHREACLAVIDMVPAVHYALARRRRGDVALAMMHNVRNSHETSAGGERSPSTETIPLHRLSSPGVTYMNLDLSLKDYGIVDGGMLDVIYNPSKEEIFGPSRSRSLQRQLSSSS